MENILKTINKNILFKYLSRNMARLIYLLCVIGMIIYLFCLYYFFRVPAIDILKFVILNIVSILVPGFAILSLVKTRIKRFTSWLFSYAIGYACIILEFFFCEIFDRKIPFSICTIVIFILSCLTIFYCKKRNIERCIIESSNDDIINVIFFLVLLLICNLIYSASNLSIDAIPVVKVFHDLSYWCENAVSLKLGFPHSFLCYDSDVGLKYHYYSSIPIAFFSEAYNIDIFSLAFSLYSMTKAAMLAGAISYLLDIVGGKTLNRIMAFTLILFSTGMDYLVNVQYIYYLYYRSFGFEIAYAFCFYFVALLIKQWKSDKFEKDTFIITMLIWISCVGGKAPFAAVIIFFAALLCLYWLFTKKVKQALFYGIGISGIFLLICWLCVGMFDIFLGNSMWKIQNNSKSKMFDLYGDVNVENKALLLLIKIICTNPTLIIGVIVSIVLIIIYNVYKRKESAYLYISLLITAMVGIVFGLVYRDGGGGSEMYFSIASFIPLTCFVMLTMNECGIVSMAENRRISYKLYVSIILLLLCVGVYNANFLYWGSNSITYWAKRGVEIVRGSFTTEDFYSADIEMGVRREDYKALEWIKNNTERDAVVVSDKSNILHEEFYMYGFMAERQQYSEGDNYHRGDRIETIVNMYNNDIGAFETIKNDGVDYIIQTKDITPFFIYDEKNMELVFSSDTINVYRIR